MTETRYNYDALNYLVEARFANGQIVRYEYDPRGNRTAVIVTPSSTANGTAGNQSSVMSPESPPTEGVPRKPPPPDKPR